MISAFKIFLPEPWRSFSLNDAKRKELRTKLSREINQTPKGSLFIEVWGTYDSNTLGNLDMAPETKPCPISRIPINDLFQAKENERHGAKRFTDEVYKRALDDLDEVLKPFTQINKFY